MANQSGITTCTACGLEYSKGEKRCPLCGVKNRKFNILASLTSKKDDPYGESDRRQNSKEINYKPTAKVRPHQNTTQNAGGRKLTSDSSAETIVKIIVSALAVMFMGPFGIFIAVYMFSRNRQSR